MREQTNHRNAPSDYSSEALKGEFECNNLAKVFLIILIIFSTFKYHFEYNEKRKFMDLQSSNLKLAVNGASLHQKLMA